MPFGRAKSLKRSVVSPTISFCLIWQPFSRRTRRLSSETRFYLQCCFISHLRPPPAGAQDHGPLGLPRTRCGETAHTAASSPSGTRDTFAQQTPHEQGSTLTSIRHLSTDKKSRLLTCCQRRNVSHADTVNRNPNPYLGVCTLQW